MTREEAIKDIQENIKPFVGGKSLDMAIEALSANPSGDLISREEAIGILKNTAWLGTDKDREETEQAVDMAIEALSADRPIKHTLPDGTEIPIDEESYEIGYTEGQMADRPTGWIPVAERLPDVDVEVLTTTDWSDVLIAWLNKDDEWETEEHILANDEILAWMPLPEPYKGGDSE